MVALESTLERIARVYTQNTGVQIHQGTSFCTDSKENIWIPPVTDQCDPFIRLMTEAGVYHEIGHILHTKKHVRDKLLHKVINAIEDAREEKLVANEYVGIRRKQEEFLRTYVEREVNTRWSRMPLMKNLLDLTYLRAKELQFGTSLDLQVPDDLNATWEKVIGRDITKKVAEAMTEEQIHKLAKIILKRMQDYVEPEPQDSREDSQDEGQKDKDPQDGDPQDGDPQDGDPQDGDPQDGDPQDGDPQDGDPQDGDPKDGDPQDGDSQDGDSQDGDPKDGDPKDGDPKDGEPEDGNAEDADTSPGSNGEPSDGDPSDGSPSDGSPSGSDDPNQSKLKGDLANEGEDVQSLGDEIKERVNDYVERKVLYRETPGIKEFVYTLDERSGWEAEFEAAQKAGRALTGYLGSKLRTLLISERAPRWYRNQRSGRLDLKRIWNDHSEEIFRRRSEHVWEDSAVSLVIDNSGSMRSKGKARYAQSLLTVLGMDLDRLRTSFEALGFTSEGHDYGEAYKGIRTQGIIINMIKRFEEPLRTVRHRFVWPSHAMGTAELPAIRFAAERLAQRRETKKAMFILSDGKTETGNTTLTSAMREATKEYVARLMQSGIFVVGFGMCDDSIAYYCPDHIILSDPADFAKELYPKLTSILLRRN